MATHGSDSSGIHAKTLKGADAAGLRHRGAASTRSDSIDTKPPHLSETGSPPAHPDPDLHPESTQTSSHARTDAKVQPSEVERMLVEQLSHIEQLRLKTSLMSSNVSKQLSLISQDLQSLQTACASRIALLDPAFPTGTTSKRAGLKSGEFAPKQFIPRESRLTVMLQIKDFATVYNIFVAVLPILCVNLLLQNYANQGQFIETSLLQYAFGSFDKAVLIWIVLFAISVASYVWKFINLRKMLPFWLTVVLYTVEQLSMVVFAGYMTLTYRLPPASALFVMCEQIRLTMKIHSFFRTHLPTNNIDAETYYATRLSGNKAGEGTPLANSDITDYLYFLFCPTLLYRVEYPRSPFVRWSHVFTRSVECVLIFGYIHIFFSRFLFPLLHVPLSSEQNLLWDLIIMSSNAMLPSMMIFVFGFFGFLHSWLNLWAELTQFADREFYRDWWNSLSFAEYYRKWNGVVYDWLYAYVYADVVMLLEKQGISPLTARSMSALFVIEFSAIMHEYIIACALGSWFPVLMFMYGGPGVIFTHFTRKQKNQNIFVWAMLFVGCGLLITLYSREFYIRKLFIGPLISAGQGIFG